MRQIYEQFIDNSETTCKRFTDLWTIQRQLGENLWTTFKQFRDKMEKIYGQLLDNSETTWSRFIGLMKFRDEL